MILFAAIVLCGFNEKRKGMKIIKNKSKENKLLMGEIHHRLKNNLQIILNLLSAQTDSHQDNFELKEALMESQKIKFVLYLLSTKTYTKEISLQKPQ